MPDLHLNSHRVAQLGHGNQIYFPNTHRLAVEILLVAHDYLARISLNLDYVQWRPGSHAKSLALPNREVMNPVVLADHAAIAGNQFACGVRQGIALLSKVCVKEVLVVAARHETNLLRIRLLREGESVVARQFANLGLSHFSKRKEGTAELFLGESEQEICLVLGSVSGTLQQPAPASLIGIHTHIMTSCKSICS